MRNKLYLTAVVLICTVNSNMRIPTDRICVLFKCTFLLILCLDPMLLIAQDKGYIKCRSPGKQLTCLHACLVQVKMFIQEWPF